MTPRTLSSVNPSARIAAEIPPLNPSPNTPAFGAQRRTRIDFPDRFGRWTAHDNLRSGSLSEPALAAKATIHSRIRLTESICIDDTLARRLPALECHNARNAKHWGVI